MGKYKISNMKEHILPVTMLRKRKCLLDLTTKFLFSFFVRKVK